MASLLDDLLAIKAKDQVGGLSAGMAADRAEVFLVKLEERCWIIELGMDEQRLLSPDRVVVRRQLSGRRRLAGSGCA